MTRKHLQTNSQDIESLRDQVADLQKEVQDLRAKVNAASPGKLKALARRKRSVRYESPAQLFGLPVVSIAQGPDVNLGQKRGHAIGWFAFGDIATGAIAIGGIARGLIAVGGVAVGIFAVGGLAMGIAAGVGGLATGYFAVGGIAVGGQIVGGLRFPLK